MFASASAQPIRISLTQPDQSAWYRWFVLVVMTITMLPILLVSLCPETMRLLETPAQDVALHESGWTLRQPTLMVQLGMPQLICLTAGHAPHPVAPTTLLLWSVIGAALCSLGALQAIGRLGWRTARMPWQAFGSPPTPPPRIEAPTH